MYYLGLDVGTQGARAVVVDGRGVCYANASVDFAGKATVTDLPPGRQEQDPRVWATSLEHAILQAVGQLDDVGVSAGDLAAAAVTSTSGTVLALDADGKPLRPALMYNDARAGEEAAEVARVGADHCARHGYRPGASFGLPKLLWLVRHEPETVDGARHLVHATDYLTGRLCGRHGVSNASDALKSCCDLFDQTWPAFLAELGIPVEKLPRLHTPGDVLGVVDPGVAERLGLPPGLKICAGCTDGTAGFLASGAAAPGESNTTIGTTLVLRTVSPDIVRDPDGRVYCHRHPDGAWLPGGASSVGAECLRVRLPDCDLDALAEHAAGALPSDSLAYPLVRPGERFPFVDPGADGFFEPEPDSETELYAAILQGVAFVERWCY
ncbi:MAG: FGGY-family carbohydrate kinase [Planctomycetota bacterium]